MTNYVSSHNTTIKHLKGRWSLKFSKEYWNPILLFLCDCFVLFHCSSCFSFHCAWADSILSYFIYALGGIGFHCCHVFTSLFFISKIPFCIYLYFYCIEVLVFSVVVLVIHYFIFPSKAWPLFGFTPIFIKCALHDVVV